MIEFILGILVGVFASPWIGPPLRKAGGWIVNRFANNGAKTNG